MIVAFTPAVGYTWPALLPAALLAASWLGYEWVQDPQRAGLPVLDKVKRKLLNSQIVSLDLALELSKQDDPINIELMEEELKSDEQLVWTKGEIVLIFRKDSRGALFIDVMGPANARQVDLREQGIAFARQVVQNFAVNRVATEMAKTNANVVEETRTAEGDVVLKLRRWV